MAIGRGVKDDDDFEGMAQVYCASKDRDGRRLAALGKSQELARWQLITANAKCVRFRFLQPSANQVNELGKLKEAD